MGIARVWETPFLSTHVRTRVRTRARYSGVIRFSVPRDSSGDPAMIIPLTCVCIGTRYRADDELLTRNSCHCIQREEAIALSVSAPRYSTTHRRCRVVLREIPCFVPPWDIMDNDAMARGEGQSGGTV